MAIKITRRAQTATPQFSLWPKALSWRLQLQLRPPRRQARFLPFASLRFCVNSIRPKAPSPLRSAGAVQNDSRPGQFARINPVCLSVSGWSLTGVFGTPEIIPARPRRVRGGWAILSGLISETRPRPRRGQFARASADFFQIPHPTRIPARPVQTGRRPRMAATCSWTPALSAPWPVAESAAPKLLAPAVRKTSIPAVADLSALKPSPLAQAAAEQPAAP